MTPAPPQPAPARSETAVASAPAEVAGVSFWDRPIAVPLTIGIATLGLFHAIVAWTNPGYWGSEPAWDEIYYLGIAREGYQLPAGDYGSYSAVPFSPGLPLLLRGLAYLTGLPPMLLRLPAAALLSVAGCVLLAWALRAFSNDIRRNNLVVAVFAAWPGSIYFRTGYAESLYFPLLAGCFGCLLRRRYLPAAALAALAWFTRTPAIVLVAALGTAIVLDTLTPPHDLRRVWRGALQLGLAMPIAALGLLGYMALLHFQVGDAWAFRKAYAAWGALETQEPRNLELKTLADAWLMPNQPTVRLSLATFLVIPLVVWPQRTRMPAVLTLFTAGAWLFFLSQDWVSFPFHDMLRWTAILFPFHFAVVLAFAALPARCRLPAWGLWFAASLCGFVWCASRFVGGHYVS